MQVLDVSKSASASTIKKAFRRLMLVQHPDKGGNPDKVRAIYSTPPPPFPLSPRSASLLMRLSVRKHLHDVLNTNISGYHFAANLAKWQLSCGNDLVSSVVWSFETRACRYLGLCVTQSVTPFAVHRNQRGVRHPFGCGQEGNLRRWPEAGQLRGQHLRQ